MPISKSLSKLKSKSDAKLHPKGRKYKQLTTAELRFNKLESVKAQRGDARQSKLDRFHFMKDVLTESKSTSLSEDELRAVCRSYIERNKPEIEQLDKARRPGRPPSNHHLRLRNLYASEMQEFESGFNIVDLTDESTCKNLQNWTGTWGGINTLKMTRITPKGDTLQ